MGTDTLAQQDVDPKTQKETNGGTNTEDTLRERAPYWMHKECKKLGLKKKTVKEETKKAIFIPHEDREAYRAEQEAEEEVIGDTPIRNPDEEETLPCRPILLPQAGADTFWRKEEQTQPKSGKSGKRDCANSTTSNRENGS